MHHSHVGRVIVCFSGGKPAACVTHITALEDDERPQNCDAYFENNNMSREKFGTKWPWAVF